MSPNLSLQDRHEVAVGLVKSKHKPDWDVSEFTSI